MAKAAHQQAQRVRRLAVIVGDPHTDAGAARGDGGLPGVLAGAHRRVWRRSRWDGGSNPLGGLLGEGVRLGPPGFPLKGKAGGRT